MGQASTDEGDTCDAEPEEPVKSAQQVVNEDEGDDECEW